jgi:SAM-dependent methyltransferase
MDISADGPVSIDPTFRKGKFSMLRNIVKSVYVHFWCLPRIHRTYKSMSIEETFRNIYLTKAWGDNGEPFCSGTGSSGQVSEQYCASVVRFIREHKVQSVVDLGCGDFAVGKRIVETSGIRYTGIDVVPELIEHHRRNVSDPRVSFMCADITNDPLPSADLYLVRQVLQHLSNLEIAKVLANLGKCSRVLISEDVPVHPGQFNVDKPHGPDVRFHCGSGVYVDRPPFSMPAVELWNVPLTGETLLRTVFLDQVILQ